MPDKLYIPVIEGTKRVKRKSINAARLVHEIGLEFEEVETELLDPNDFNFPGDGNDPEGKDPRYTAITERADGFFIVTPEYNHSFPGTLKRMLDSELTNYIHKAVAFAGVSNGRWGGVRAIEGLVHTVREMGMAATFTDSNFPKVDDLFNEEGELQDEAMRDVVRATWTELIWMATVLRYGRQHVKSKYH